MRFYCVLALALAFTSTACSLIPMRPPVQRLGSPTTTLLYVNPRHSKSSANLDKTVTREDSVDDPTKNKLAAVGLGALAVASLGFVATGGIREAGALMDSIKSLDINSLSDFSDQVESLGPLGYLYFSIIYIVLEILALPAIPLTASAGYLFGVLPGTFVTLLSATIAAGVSFLIGRTFLRSYIEKLAKDNKTFQAIDAAVGKEGFKVVFLLRLSPLLPFALSNYLYGLTAVELLPYMAGTFFGFAPGTLAYVYTGDAAKALSESGGGTDALPWYAYAGVFVFIVAIGRVASDIASEAIASMDD